MHDRKSSPSDDHVPIRPVHLYFSDLSLEALMNISASKGQLGKMLLLLIPTVGGGAALMETIGSQSARAQQNATVTEAPIVPDRILVIFNESTLPDDAAARIAAAGGQIIRRMAGVGVAVAAPSTADGATLLRNLRNDPAILDADYDRMVGLIAPTQMAADDAADVSPKMMAHPLPTFSTALPPDFFYTSTPQQWPAKRIGAAGGGIATPPGAPTSGAWDVTFGAGAKIAILDTGVNPVHPDVKDNLVFNLALTSYSAGFGTPNCEVPDASNPPFDLPADQNGHGTWTSSLAAGEIGGGLLIGVAPQAKILNIKVLRNLAATPAQLNANNLPDTPYNRCLLRNGSGFFSWVLEGMVVATLEGADVISMSLGGFVPRNLHGGAGAALWSAFNRVSNFATSHGTIVFAAAGNAALNLDQIRAFVELPAEASGVIPVIATTNPALFPPTPPARQPCTVGADCLAFYSDFGTKLGGLSAPGGDLPGGGCAFSGSPCLPTGFVRGGCSSGLVGTVPPDPSSTFGAGGPPAGTSFGCFGFAGLAQHAWYVQATGTSASTPIAAGVAALVKSANSGLSPAQIRTIMQQTAQDIGKGGYNALFNFGLVDANAAVHKAIR